MRLGLGLGLGAHRKVRSEPYSDVLALEYDLTQITEPTTIALAIQADSSWFNADQEASIDWGDGSAHTVVSATSGQSGYIAHEYADAATYLVKVSGTMKAYQRATLDDLDSQDLLTHIRSFGKLGIESFAYAFYRCTGLISVPKYCPESISDMANMFRDCSGANFNPDVSNWDVSSVESMQIMFSNCSGANFNPDVSAWDVSSVKNMAYMFSGCSGTSFNPNVSNWDVSSVENMRAMFYNCRGAAFNPDVSSWDVSSVKNMLAMFYNCSGAAFNPDVSAWDVSSVTHMQIMFNGCSGAAFNPDVSSWDVSNVTNMAYMFNRCSGASFKGNGIKNWKLKSGVNAVSMDSFMAGAKVQTATWLDDILSAWAALIGDPTNPLPSNIIITFQTNQPYTGSVSGAALTALVEHGWTISTLVDVEA